MTEGSEAGNDRAFAILDSFEKRWDSRYPESERGKGPWLDGSIMPCLFAIRIVQGLEFNGGWPSVYYNRAGWAVRLAVHGYHEIGAPLHEAVARNAAAVVAEAERREPGMDHSSDEWLSGRLMELVGEPDWDRLDDGWLDAEYSENTYLLMSRYIEDHGLLGS
ncbi:MAG: hypothetical protein WD749_10540 [Phycisphaerales bacterium]